MRDGYQEFIEPRQLTLDRQDLGEAHLHSHDSLLRQEQDNEALTQQDPLSRPYAGIETADYRSPDALEFNIRGGSRSPFMWSGDYGPNMMDPPPEFPPLPLGDWGTRLDDRHSLGMSCRFLKSATFAQHE